MGHIVRAHRPVDSAKGCDCGKAQDEVAAEITQVLLAARLAAEREVAAAKDAAVLLARRMAERIVGHAVDVDPTVMADIAARALAASRARAAAVVLRVHPDDLAAVEQARPGWLARAEAPAQVRLVADASVGRYGCVVDTPAGRVDARLATQLDVLERALTGARKD